MRRTGKGLKAAVNDALRRGFAGAGPGQRLPKFVVHARPLGLRPGYDPDRLNQLVDQLEVDETVRKLRA